MKQIHIKDPKKFSKVDPRKFSEVDRKKVGELDPRNLVNQIRKNEMKFMMKLMS